MSASAVSLSYVEAKRLVTEFKGGESLSFLFAASGTTEPFALFLKAAGAKLDRTVVARTVPFNTLGQLLCQAPVAGEMEIFLLLPWDFAPELDWRSGIPVDPPDETTLRQHALATVDHLARRPRARVLYLPAPVPPLWSDPRRSDALRAWLESLVRGLGARLLPEGAFSLGSYFFSGCPVNGAWIGRVAEAVVDTAHAPPVESAKVLVTDLDNVLWAGVIADDALDGIAFGPDGIGYRHHVYQTFLARLRREGVLLAAATRNDLDVVREALRSGRMPLAEEDFIAILAGYVPKSSQLRTLAQQLNLGFEAFVFVDDNLVELAEVSQQLPALRVLAFPARDDELPGLLDRLVELFPRREVTSEDKQRTELYRRGLAVRVPTEAPGTDLTRFLRGLQMRLTVHRRSSGDRTRAVQLINKTNQFNLNGRRMCDDEIEQILRAGGQLYSVSLRDRTGDQGEILACLVAPDRTIVSMVLSCRVFQRRVEYAFLAWLGGRPDSPQRLAYAPTPRNEPFRRFLRDIVGAGPDELSCEQMLAADFGPFPDRYAADLDLFLRTDARSP